MSDRKQGRFIVALLTESGCVPPYIFAECDTEKDGHKQLKRLRKMTRDEIRDHFGMEEGEAKGNFELVLVERQSVSENQDGGRTA